MKLLVSGTRRKGYDQIVRMNLDILKPKISEIIEGCCPNSADKYTEDWANENDIKLNHHPSTSRNYLKRNIEMVKKCDEVIAFWDGFSYGTAHTIATAVAYGKKAIVIMIR